jgi:uncharacterized protein
MWNFQNRSPTGKIETDKLFASVSGQQEKIKVEVDFELMATIHRTLRQETDLNERMTRGPRRIQVAAEAQRRFEGIVQELNDSLAETKKSVTAKQRQMDQREAHIEKMTGQRNSCTNNKEYQLLTDQIAADKQANSVLEDEILELLGRVDDFQQQLSEATVKAQQAKKETQRVTDEVQQQIGNLKAEFDRVNSERLELEKALPKDIMLDYRRLVASSGEAALAAVDDKSCGNCSSILPPRLIDSMRRSQSVKCFSCSAFLYLPENRSVRSTSNS